jgi:CRISPR-associated protein Cmx8
VTSATATVRFTKQSLQGLFDDLYDADLTESEHRDTPRKKSKSKEVIPPFKTVPLERRNEKTGKTSTVTGYVYRDVTPALRMLRQMLPEQGGWLKLWRNMLWEIPRGIPKTRIPFEDRAAGKPCKEGSDAWQALLKVEQARQQSGFFTQEVSSALWLVAQSANAEGIPFQGRAEHNLLLHFWPLTVLICVPQQIDADGARDFAGYVLAIPEVADLESFLVDYPAMLSQLGTEVAGFRPAEAVIDLPKAL